MKAICYFFFLFCETAIVVFKCYVETLEFVNIQNELPKNNQELKIVKKKM